MAGLERGERLQIMLTEEELAAVENWRFDRRMPSRAAAVRELLRRGLAAEGFLTAEQGTKSQDFGILSNQGSGDGEGSLSDS
jgi:hypothetical protein